MPEGSGGRGTGVFDGGACGESLCRRAAEPSSQPKSRPLGAVSLETRLRARPLGRESRREAPQPFDPVRRGSGERAHNVCLCKQYTNITGKYGGICRTTNSAATDKFRRQVGRGWQSGSGGL